MGRGSDTRTGNRPQKVASHGAPHVPLRRLSFSPSHYSHFLLIVGDVVVVAIMRFSFCDTQSEHVATSPERTTRQDVVKADR